MGDTGKPATNPGQDQTSPPNIVTGQRVDRVTLQRAKELRRQMTPEERILWQALRAHRLRDLQFRRQQVIEGFIVDFYCHAAALMVEVDGPIHEQQPDYDAERDRTLAARGLRVIRLKNEEVRRNLASVLASVAAQALDRIPSQRRLRTASRCEEGPGGALSELAPPT